jgi:membrane protein
MAFFSIRLKEAWNWGGLSFKQLMVRTYKSMNDHDTWDQAAVVAFYAMLALVPFLGFVLAVGLGASHGVADEILILSAKLIPREAHHIIEDQVHKIETSAPVGVLSIGFIILLWSSSSLFVAVMDTMNACYGVQDSRSWLKRRLLAILLTVIEAILMVGGAVSIIAWPYVTDWLGISGWTAALATVVQWLVVLVLLLAGFATAYYFAPHVGQKWEWITPGSVFGVLILIVASLGFRFYLRFGSSSSETYGALAGVVLMLLWLYILGLALLVGAEVNSVIEHAAPHGKAPGQKEEPDKAGAGASRGETVHA